MKVTYDLIYTKVNQESIFNQSSYTKIPLYASLDANYEGRKAHKIKGAIDRQNGIVRPIKSALKAAQNREFSITAFSWGPGGLRPRGRPNALLVELEQNDQNQEQTVESTAEFVERSVESRLKTEDGWLKRLYEMRKERILPHLEELRTLRGPGSENRGIMHQLAWFELLKGLERQRYEQMLNEMKKWAKFLNRIYMWDITE